MFQSPPTSSHFPASGCPGLFKYIVAVNITGPASGMGSHAKAQSQVVELAMARCEALGEIHNKYPPVMTNIAMENCHL